jgi:hypothetical protein
MSSNSPIFLGMDLQTLLLSIATTISFVLHAFHLKTHFNLGSSTSCCQISGGIDDSGDEETGKLVNGPVKNYTNPIKNP